MDKNNRNNGSRYLHCRVFACVCIGFVVLLNFNLWADGPSPDTSSANVIVTVPKFASVEFLADTTAMGPLPKTTISGVEYGTIPLSDFEFINGVPSPNSVTGSAKLKILTNCTAILTVPESVQLSLIGGNLIPEQRPVVGIALNTTEPPNSISRKSGTSDQYVVAAPTGTVEPPQTTAPGIQRVVTANVTMTLTNWAFSNPQGLYAGILTVTISTD